MPRPVINPTCRDPTVLFLKVMANPAPGLTRLKKLTVKRAKNSAQYSCTLDGLLLILRPLLGRDVEIVKPYLTLNHFQNAF